VAFDCVDYDILLMHLQRFVGVSGQVFSWILSFLTERSQRVVYAGSLLLLIIAVGCTTRLCIRATAVPSLHGRAFDIIVSHGASAHFYTDDGQLYVNSLAADTDDTINCLQACVAAVEQWMKSNRLRLNPQKMQLIWLRSQQQLDKVTTTDIQLLNARSTHCLQYEILASQSTVGLRWPTTSPPFAVLAISGCARCKVLFSR